MQLPLPKSRRIAAESPFSAPTAAKTGPCEAESGPLGPFRESEPAIGAEARRPVHAGRCSGLIRRRRPFARLAARGYLVFPPCQRRRPGNSVKLSFAKTRPDCQAPCFQSEGRRQAFCPNRRFVPAAGPRIRSTRPAPPGISRPGRRVPVRSSPNGRRGKPFGSSPGQRTYPARPCTVPGGAPLTALAGCTLAAGSGTRPVRLLPGAIASTWHCAAGACTRNCATWPGGRVSWPGGP